MDGSFETMFPSVVEWVDSHYRTIAEKSSRAIAGLSMGGFHSMQISKEYPTMFDYVGLFSAAIFRGNEEVATYQRLEENIYTHQKQGVFPYIKYRKITDSLTFSPLALQY